MQINNGENAVPDNNKFETESEPASSRFVSGGTVDKPTERDAEWIIAQRELDQRSLERAQKAKGLLAQSKSLFEQLQENKDKKLSELEVRKEFRPLDEDEIEYLNSVNDKSYQKDLALRREMGERLSNFRQQQREQQQKQSLPTSEGESGEGVVSVLAQEAGIDQQTWKVGPKKRKIDDRRRKLGNLVKKPRAESRSNSPPLSIEKHTIDKRDDISSTKVPEAVAEVVLSEAPSIGTPKTKPKNGTSGLGLTSYSDSDSDGW